MEMLLLIKISTEAGSICFCVLQDLVRFLRGGGGGREQLIFKFDIYIFQGNLLNAELPQSGGFQLSGSCKYHNQSGRQQLIEIVGPPNWGPPGGRSLEAHYLPHLGSGGIKHKWWGPTSPQVMMWFHNAVPWQKRPTALLTLFGSGSDLKHQTGYFLLYLCFYRKLQKH